MKHKSLFLIPLAACLILAGCGDDKTPKTSASETPASASSDVGSLPVSSEAPVSSSVAPKPATGVAIAEGATATVKKGKTLTLHATVTPDDADDKTVTWSSENAAIASVSAAGVVTGVAKGTVKITASSAVQGVKAEITITVLETTITISGEDSAYIGGEIQLSAATENAEGTVAWSSSAPTIASVDQTGKVSALAEGDAIITAAVDGVTATKTVHILAHKLDATKMGLPASYKMEFHYTHDEDIVREGTKDDPRSFHPSADNDNGVLITPANYRSGGLYYRFKILTAGIYRLYSHSSSDPKIGGFYKYNADGTLPSGNYSAFVAGTTYVDDYKDTALQKLPDGQGLTSSENDFYSELELEVGEYAVLVSFWGNASDMVFHIESKGDNPIYPEGPADTETVIDTYELDRVEGVGYYSKATNSGAMLKNGKVYPFAYVADENDYILQKDEMVGFDLASTAISNMAGAGVAAYVKTEDGSDYFTIGTTSGFGQLIVSLLGVDPALVGNFSITADAATGAINGATISVGDQECDVILTPIDALPVNVSDYPVTNGGEYDGGGDANQDW